MTEARGPLDAIDEALASATPTLDADERRLAVAFYRLLAEGKAVNVADAATRAGVSPLRAAQAIRSWPAVFSDDDGRVAGFWGLALNAMPHSVCHGGIDLYTWCAWDPLFLARIIGELEVRTRDPVSGIEITYSVTQAGRILELDHPSGALSFLAPDQPWDNDVMTNFCHFVWQFTSQESAAIWIADNPGTFALSLDEASELARRHFDRTFSGAL